MTGRRRRWKPGYARRAAELAESAGVALLPWQREVIEQIEQRDVDAEFRDVTRGVRPAD